MSGFFGQLDYPPFYIKKSRERQSKTLFWIKDKTKLNRQEDSSRPFINECMDKVYGFERQWSTK